MAAMFLVFDWLLRQLRKSSRSEVVVAALRHYRLLPVGRALLYGRCVFFSFSIEHYRPLIGPAFMHQTLLTGEP